MSDSTAREEMDWALYGRGVRELAEMVAADGYRPDMILERLEVPVVLPPQLDLVDHRQSKVLIADDVADTGHTLKLVRDYCLDEVAEVRSAVLYEKSHLLVKCEYVWRRTDRWINFPWSTLPPVVDLAEAGFKVLDA